MNEQSIKIYDLMNKIKKEISLKQEYIASELERASTNKTITKSIYDEIAILKELRLHLLEYAMILNVNIENQFYFDKVKEITFKLESIENEFLYNVLLEWNKDRDNVNTARTFNHLRDTTFENIDPIAKDYTKEIQELKKEISYLKTYELRNVN